MRRSLLALALLVGTAAAVAGIPELGDKTPGTTVRPAVGAAADLGDPDRAQDAVRTLVASGTKGTETLARVAQKEDDLSMRGWAITGLVHAEGKQADDALDALMSNGSEAQLVRTWAYAAKLGRAKSLDAIVKLAPMASQYPGSERAIELAAAPYLAEADAIELLKMSAKIPALNAGIGPRLLEVPSSRLNELMLTHSDNEVRRGAAAWLGTQAGSGKYDTVADSVIGRMAFEKNAKRVPWQGGALYVPGMQWKQKEARRMVRNLILWHEYTRHNGSFASEKQQVYNNLASVQLLQAAGFSNAWPGEEGMLVEWEKIEGAADVKRIRELTR